MLTLAEVGTSTFKAHSTRSASTSKASSLGVSTSEIVKRGQWASDSTFKKFYCKEISSTESFLLAVTKL